MPVHRFAELSGPAAGEAGPGLVAIQPIGAIEHHGPHLPLVTDALIAGAVAEAVVDARPDLPLTLLPTISYALSSEHLWAPGTITLSPSTLLGMLDDLGASLARAGVPRLVFLNGHGGNSALLRVACREIRVRHGLMTFLAHPHVPVDQGGHGAADAEEGFAVHGSAGETSMVMHLRPDLVSMDLAERSLPRWLADYQAVGFGGEVTFGWSSNDVMASGVIGDPTLASPEEGKEHFERCVERLGLAMEEIARFSYPGAGR
ncbi:MAG TPA: creatininase family protein [Acidimicrobiales bacterium]|jgi:creatinine amidohydrolase|nr:creatininase family protein [Acidimicrobiales bacterium]